MDSASNKEAVIRGRYESHKRRCADDFPYFARTELLIDTKGGGKPVLFELNRAQKYVYDSLKRQYDSLGFMRAHILKSRQQGMSTMIAAMIFHACVTRDCMNCVLVSKEAKATKVLFSKIKRFITERPICQEYAEVGTFNLDEVAFNRTKSIIRCLSAQGEQIARGSTNQCIFASEAPYWDNGIQQVSALLDGLGRLPNTMVIMESTAKGKDPLFYAGYQMGKREDSEWVSLFTPWFWSDEYRIALKPNEKFEPTASEQVIISKHGVTLEQLKWRRMKLMEYRTSDPEAEFRREYPCTEDEAFEESIRSTFFDMGAIRGASGNQKFDATEGEELIIGADIGAGCDPTVLCFRKGPNVEMFMDYTSDSLIDTREWLAKQIRMYRPNRMFVDNGGVGLAVAQELAEMFRGVVRGVNFGERADDIENYSNKRAEIFDRTRAYFNNGAVSLCKNDDLMAEMAAVSAEPDKVKLAIASKDSIRRIIGRSTNYLDALALTFAEEYSIGTFGGANLGEVYFRPLAQGDYVTDGNCNLS